ncbi:hypothetical protein BZA77DRAFT_313041 [Pyronema omphalodes]|nr:hypothetical protein BZA77DRAFT_313041 [Pyronema omphalodes]
MPVAQEHPITDATLTIRVIKNFPYRTTKNVILHNIDLTTMTAGELKQRVLEHTKTHPSFKAYRTFNGDSLKLYTKAHGTKTNNLIINMEDENEELMFTDDAKTLAEYGCEHETEISFFVMTDYLAFKANPEVVALF